MIRAWAILWVVMLCGCMGVHDNCTVKRTTEIQCKDGGSVIILPQP